MIFMVRTGETTVRRARARARPRLVLFCLFLLAGCGRDEEVAEVSSMPGPPGSDPGPGLEYPPETLSRFRQLLENDQWSPADPPRSPQGMLEAVHAGTGLPFVLVPAFLLARTECTQRAWDRIGGADARAWNGDDLPIEGVTWLAVSKWCEAAGLRLPTEAEWEYACRAERWDHGALRRHLRDEASPFTGRPEPDEISRVAWFYRNSGDRPCPPGEAWSSAGVDAGGTWNCRSHAVGGKAPNAWGLFDMLGNVYEWCEDTYHRSYHGAPRDGRAWVAEAGGPRIWRGGSWHSPVGRCRSNFRDYSDETTTKPYVGFRPAADLPRLKEPDGD